MYADQSDFLRSTGCQVYTPLFRTLWGLNATLWAGTTIICVAALLSIKRRTRPLEHFDRKHALVCFVSSFSAVVFSALQLASDSSSGAIAVDAAPSIMFGISQTMCWTALVLKPSTKSETSIARFAMEQTKSIMTLYFVLAPIFMLCLVASSISAIVGGFIEAEHEIVVTYFVSEYTYC
jgi:predicted cation transporter